MSLDAFRRLGTGKVLIFFLSLFVLEGCSRKRKSIPAPDKNGPARGLSADDERRRMLETERYERKQKDLCSQKSSRNYEWSGSSCTCRAGYTEISVSGTSQCVLTAEVEKCSRQIQGGVIIPNGTGGLACGCADGTRGITNGIGAQGYCPNAGVSGAGPANGVIDPRDSCYLADNYSFTRDGECVCKNGFYKDPDAEQMKCRPNVNILNSIGSAQRECEMSRGQYSKFEAQSGTTGGICVCTYGETKPNGTCMSQREAEEYQRERNERRSVDTSSRVFDRSTTAIRASDKAVRNTCNNEWKIRYGDANNEVCCPRVWKAKGDKRLNLRFAPSRANTSDRCRNMNDFVYRGGKQRLCLVGAPVLAPMNEFSRERLNPPAPSSREYLLRIQKLTDDSRRVDGDSCLYEGVVKAVDFEQTRDL